MRAALALRDRVFCIEQGVPKREELDGRDGEAIHLVAVDEGVVVGTCRLLIVDKTVQFSRLAVEPSRAAVRGSRRGCWSPPTPRRSAPARGGSCCTPRPTRATSTSPTATNRAVTSSSKRA